MKTRYKIILGLLWIALGAFLSAPYWISMIRPATSAAVSQAAVDTSEPINVEEPTITGTPTRIQLQSLGIDNEIIPGTFDAASNSWTLSRDKAQYATTTALPNNKTGNTFIYGHNNGHVFNKLVDAQPGLEAVVTTDNGHVFTYVLDTITDAAPSDVSYLADHKSPILTVQTCSGLWYEKRRMFVFHLTGVV